MTDMNELKALARTLGVDLSADPVVQQAYDEEHAEYVGTGLRQVRREPDESLNERVYDALRAAGKKVLADEFSDAFPQTIPYRNAWGDDPNQYSEEFCRECAKLLPGHYTNCSPEGRAAANAAVSNTTPPSQLGTNERIHQ